MQAKPDYFQKELKFTYQQFQRRGKTLQNLIIDKYVVYNQIGQGSNGQVYKAMDDKTKKQVAIKVMDLRAIRNEQSDLIKEIKQRLCESEPRLMYQCDSPNLIKCFDVYRNDDLKVMAIEYCNGKTLQAEIDEKRRIPQAQAVMIAKHVIMGMMELHRHNIIHRDLKAENIMSHNGTYKIIDFGFSKKLQIAQENAEVKGTSLGTITTMAPQVMSRKPYGLKADIWSLGIIFFQMLYGVYPYDSLTARALYHEIKTKKLFEDPNPRTINGHTPTKKAYDFIKFLIVFEPGERPNWKEVAEYPLIKNDSEQVNQRFIQRVEVKVDQKIYELHQKAETVNGPVFEEDTAAKVISEKMKKAAEEQQKRKEKERQREAEREKERLRELQKEKEKEKQKLKEMQKEKEKRQIDPQRFKISQQNKQKQEQRQKPKRFTLNIEENIRLQKEKEEQRKQQLINELKTKQEKKGLMPAQLVRELNKDEVIKKKNEQDKEENEEFEFTERSNIECLKTQFIFRDLFTPLTQHYRPQDDRQIIEFLYLLLARCFNNMSPIQHELLTRKSKKIIQNLQDQITPLYNRVQTAFIDYSGRLTAKENKVMSILGDLWSKNVKSEAFKEKDRFLTGIEFANYSKEQQIDYTHKMYVSSLEKKVRQNPSLRRVAQIMSKYTEINAITQSQLAKGSKTFEQTVKDMLR